MTLEGDDNIEENHLTLVKRSIKTTCFSSCGRKSNNCHKEII